MAGFRRRSTNPGPSGAPDPGPSTTWFASAALVGLVIVALIGVLIYIAVRPESPQASTAVGPVSPAPSAPAAAPATSASGDSDPGRPPGCHTTGSDQTIPTGTPAGITWTLVKGVAIPSSPSDGPTLHTGAGVGYCYAHTPLGALLAAANLGRGTGTPTEVQRDSIEHLVVPNEYSAQAAAQPPAPDTGTDIGAQLAGFRFIAYSSSQASIALVVSITGNPGTYGVSTVAMEWNQGDWRVVTQPGPSPIVTSSSVTSLSGYVAWSGVS